MQRVQVAPNLTTISDAEIPTTVECSERSVKPARSNLLHFGSTRAPSNGGHLAKITPPMKAALQEHLLENPALYQEEMMAFLNKKLEYK